MKRHSRKFSPSALLITLSCTLINCGLNRETQDEFKEVKSYKFSCTVTANPSCESLGRLVDEFNERAHLQVLELRDESFLESTGQHANSSFQLAKDLRATDGKLGVGAWVVEERSTTQRTVAGQTKTIEHNYSMDITFDADFYHERQDLEEDDTEWQRLFLLFCHEVGHGLKMEHDSITRGSVMYPTIGDPLQVDYSSFFANVRTFMQQ